MINNIFKIVIILLVPVLSWAGTPDAIDSTVFVNKYLHFHKSKSVNGIIAINDILETGMSNDNNISFKIDTYNNDQECHFRGNASKVNKYTYNYSDGKGYEITFITNLKGIEVIPINNISGLGPDGSKCGVKAVITTNTQFIKSK